MRFGVELTSPTICLRAFRVSGRPGFLRWKSWDRISPLCCSCCCSYSCCCCGSEILSGREAVYAGPVAQSVVHVVVFEMGAVIFLDTTVVLSVSGGRSLERMDRGLGSSTRRSWTVWLYCCFGRKCKVGTRYDLRCIGKRARAKDNAALKRGKQNNWNRGLQSDRLVPGSRLLDGH